MKLYYAPQSCALAPHIVAAEAGIPITAVSVDIPTLKTDTGIDYLTINPKGFVPALELSDGQVLTENAAILQFLADQAPAVGLAPPNGTFERSRLHEMLHYLGTDIHRGYSPLFRRETPAQTREERQSSLRRHYAVLDTQLSRTQFLLGHQFSVADAVSLYLDALGEAHSVGYFPVRPPAKLPRACRRASCSRCSNARSRSDRRVTP